MHTSRRSPWRRRLTTALAVLCSACIEDCEDTVEPLLPTTTYVTVIVEMGGDGDGRVDVSTNSDSWSCTLAAGAVTVSGGGVTQSGNRCQKNTEVRSPGSVTFSQFPASGSTFGAWFLDCSGPDLHCQRAHQAGSPITVGAGFLFRPTSLTVTVAPEPLFPGATTVATATFESSRPIQDPVFEWTSDAPTIATVSGTGAQATVTAHAPGTADIRARLRQVNSNTVPVTVGQLPPGQGVLRGRVLDGTTPLDSIYVIVEPIAGSSGTSGLRGWSGRPIPGEPGVIPPGGFLFEVASGQYVVGVSGFDGSRWVSTSGDTALVLAGDTTVSDRDVRRGYHLDMLDTDLTVAAAAGGNVDVTLDFRVWNRIHCPGCVPSIAIGVEGEPVAVHRFDSPGTHPGLVYANQALSFTAPSAGGTIYAVLVIASTATSLEPGFEEYRRLWADPLKLRFVPIGTLQVN